LPIGVGRPSEGDGLLVYKCHPPSHPSQDSPMPQPASAAFLRLRNYIAKQMRMSPIDQPLTLMELLGRSSPAPAQDVARRILGSGWWARFTFNGITAYGNGA